MVKPKFWPCAHGRNQYPQWNQGSWLKPRRAQLLISNEHLFVEIWVDKIKTQQLIFHLLLFSLIGTSRIWKLKDSFAIDQSSQQSWLCIFLINFLKVPQSFVRSFCVTVEKTGVIFRRQWAPCIVCPNSSLLWKTCKYISWTQFQQCTLKKKMFFLSH